MTLDEAITTLTKALEKYEADSALKAEAAINGGNNG